MSHNVLLMLMWAMFDASLVAQQVPNVNGGTWEFTINSFSARLQVARTGPFAFGGQFVSGTGAIFPGFTGQILSDTSRTADVIFRWDSANRDVPGVGAGALYFGNVASDGNSMQGQYGLSPSQTLGSWSAKLVSAAAPPTVGLKCDVTAVNGTYAYIQTGFILGGDHQGIFAAAGRIVADGSGNFTGVDSASLNGTITQARKLRGLYTVNNDCTGTIQFLDDSNVPLAGMLFVISSGGKIIQFIQNESGTAITGTAYQQ